MLIVLGGLGLIVWASRREQIRNAEMEIEEDARHEAEESVGEA